MLKKIVLAVNVIVVVGIIYLAVSGSEVQEIKTEIDIAAPPSKVWQVITDIKKWQDWSPIINASQGEASVGSELSITMMGKEKGKDGPKYNPVITELKEPGYFHWRAHMMVGFVFTNDKIFKLEETKTGTRVTHIETFKGLLAPIFCDQMEKGVPPMLNAMNKALKAQVESK